MSDFNDTGRRDLQRIKELEATIARMLKLYQLWIDSGDVVAVSYGAQAMLILEAEL